MSTLICDDASLAVSQYPCLSCLSESELFAVLILGLAPMAGYTLPGDQADMIKDSACFTCLSDKQMLQGVASIPAFLSFEGKTTQQIRDEIKCLVCTDQKRMKAMLVMLLCKTANQIIMNANLLDCGIATLANGTATVTSAYADSGNTILLSYFSLDNTGATVVYNTVVNGVSFMISSTNPTDTNLVSWAILKQP